MISPTLTRDSPFYIFCVGFFFYNACWFFFSVLFEKKNCEILVRLNCASGEFFAARLLFSVVLRNTGKSGFTTTKRIVFFLLLFFSAFDKKYCAEEENEFFFSECIHYSAKKKKLLSENKNGKQFFVPPSSRYKKYISAIKFLQQLFFLLFCLLYPFSFSFIHLWYDNKQEAQPLLLIYIIHISQHPTKKKKPKMISSNLKKKTQKIHLTKSHAFNFSYI